VYGGEGWGEESPLRHRYIEAGFDLGMGPDVSPHPNPLPGGERERVAQSNPNKNGEEADGLLPA